MFSPPGAAMLFSPPGATMLFSPRGATAAPTTMVPAVIELMPVHTFDDALTMPDDIYVAMDDDDNSRRRINSNSLLSSDTEPSK